MSGNSCPLFCDPDRTDFTFIAMSRMNHLMCMWIETILRPNSGWSQLTWPAIWGSRQKSCAEFKDLSWSRSRHFWRLGMGILALTPDERVVDVKFSRDTLSVDLRD